MIPIVGTSEPPVRTPLGHLVPAGQTAYGNAQELLRRTIAEVLDGMEIAPDPAWVMFWVGLAEAISGGGGGGLIGTLYSDLTPADNVLPALELVEEGGTLGVLLDRALTTIDPAELNGATPPDGWKFTLKAFNDATNGRGLAFDAVYHGWQTSSGVALAVESYTFTTIAGEFWIDAQEIGVL